MVKFPNFWGLFRAIKKLEITIYLGKGSINDLTKHGVGNISHHSQHHAALIWNCPDYHPNNSEAPPRVGCGEATLVPTVRIP